MYRDLKKQNGNMRLNKIKNFIFRRSDNQAYMDKLNTVGWSGETIVISFNFNLFKMSIKDREFLQ